MPIRETDLYPPIKALLESQGYAVKGEVGDCDVVGVREGEPPVVVELKTSFTLQLVFQAVRRLALTDHVYVAFGLGGAGASTWRRNRKDIVKLCRRLGLGLILVEVDKPGLPTDVHLDPGPYQPRQNKARRGHLLREFQRRVGDPNRGGTTRKPIMTAYRQDALRCAHAIATHGPTQVATIRSTTGVETAGRILQRDVYGWFMRIERGVYALTPNGEKALKTFAEVVSALATQRSDKAS